MMQWHRIVLYGISLTEAGSMAKQAARPRIRARQTGAGPEAGGAPDAATHEPDGLTEVTRRTIINGQAPLTNLRMTPVRKRTARDTGNDEAKRRAAIEDPMARRLSEGFAEAARQAVLEAHAAGLAVPAREHGVAVEIRPDGEVVPIDDNAPWSPTDWRSPARR
jgi:hypothetical protein